MTFYFTTLKTTSGKKHIPHRDQRKRRGNDQEICIFVQYTLSALLTFLLLLSTSSCSYFKMTLNNEKDKILKKIPPLSTNSKVENADFHNLVPRFTNYHRSLADLVFDQTNGEKGLFFPDRFLEEIKNNFYTLDIDPAGKIPVVFVHGAAGTPEDWKYVIKNMNREIFSPIVYYYPTGIRLNTSTSLLYEGIKEINNKYGQVIIIAHSMGGLVARGALSLLMLDKRTDTVPLYISLSVPYGGHADAQDGIERLPESAIVPSWKDIASGSEFIKTLFTPTINSSTEFYLLFGYKNPKKIRIGSNSDGSITIKSQLDFRAQMEAKRLYGFDDDHETILKDEKVTSIINEILEKTAQKIDLRPK